MHLHHLMTHAPLLSKWMGQKYNCNLFFDLTKEQGHFQVQCTAPFFLDWDLSPNNSHMILFLLLLWFTDAKTSSDILVQYSNKKSKTVSS